MDQTRKRENPPWLEEQKEAQRKEKGYQAACEYLAWLVFAGSAGPLLPAMTPLIIAAVPVAIKILYREYCNGEAHNKAKKQTGKEGLPCDLDPDLHEQMIKELESETDQGKKQEITNQYKQRQAKIDNARLYINSYAVTDTDRKKDKDKELLALVNPKDQEKIKKEIGQAIETAKHTNNLLQGTNKQESKPSPNCGKQELLVLGGKAFFETMLPKYSEGNDNEQEETTTIKASLRPRSPIFRNWLSRLDPESFNNPAAKAAAQALQTKIIDYINSDKSQNSKDILMGDPNAVKEIIRLNKELSAHITGPKLEPQSLKAMQCAFITGRPLQAMPTARYQKSLLSVKGETEQPPNLPAASRNPGQLSEHQAASMLGAGKPATPIAPPPKPFSPLGG